MQKLLPAPVSSKGQVTLPKMIREILGIDKEGDIVNFVIHQGQIVLTRGFFVAPASVSFSPEELEQLRTKAKKTGKRSFRSPQTAIQFLNKI